MIGAEHEQAQAGGGELFADSVSLDFCDPEGELCGLIRLTRRPNADAATAFVFMRADEHEATHELDGGDTGGWEQAALDGVRLETLVPLESWRASVEHAGLAVELEARAVSSPLEPAAGGPQYEQLCELTGTVDAGAGARPLRCLGRRVHRWGDTDWSELVLLRSIYAASDAMRAVMVTSARRARSTGHGDEERAGYLITADEEPRSFEEVRISTVYGDGERPRKAGLELFLPGEELPRRLGGEELCTTETTAGDVRHAVSFFRWSLEGVPAFGAYELVGPR